MQLTRKILVYTAVFFGLGVGLVLAHVPRAYAAAPVFCPNGENLKTNPRICCPKGAANEAKDCLYGKYINPAINVLSAIAGVAIVIGILVGSIQYSSSGGDPQKTAQGKGKIVKSIVALVSFMFLFGAIQFMSPGGVYGDKMSGSGTIAQRCSPNTFMGLKPWFYYMPDAAFEGVTCNIDDFDIFSVTNGLVPVALVVADDLVIIAGLVAVAYVIVGGVQFVTSQGEADRTKRARETIINALIGVVMAVVAASVVSFVGQKLSA
jgi:hypothetical protein